MRATGTKIIQQTEKRIVLYIIRISLEHNSSKFLTHKCHKFIISTHVSLSTEWPQRMLVIILRPSPPVVSMVIYTAYTMLSKRLFEIKTDISGTISSLTKDGCIKQKTSKVLKLLSRVNSALIIDMSSR